MLSDDVLLEIFDSCRKCRDYTCHDVWKWHLLVHVCQRWRQVIFASPHRLNLQLLCTSGTPVRRNLSIWPPFPIAMEYFFFLKSGLPPEDEDNVIVALKHPNRVCYVKLGLTNPQLGRVATAMQEPFPVLKYLSIFLVDRNAPALSADFLGGRAPCLQEVTLFGVPYPALPTLLLSASHLVTLTLRNIPAAGFISPETLVVGLAALHRLECFILGFQLVTPSPDRMPPPRMARTVLPSLTSFEFAGANEYLENLVIRLDSPRLNRILITYLYDNIQIGPSQLSEFISRSIGPHLALFKHAQVTFFKDMPLTWFAISPSKNHQFSFWGCTGMGILCEVYDLGVSRMSQVVSQCYAALSNVVHLRLTAKFTGPSLDPTCCSEWTYGIAWARDFEWHRLLYQFPTAETLHVSWDLAEHIASALEYSVSGETGAAEALPSLNLICLASQPASSIEKFLTARRLSGRPITIIRTEREFFERVESYGTEKDTVLYDLGTS
jgi:hypothetical protein